MIRILPVCGHRGHGKTVVMAMFIAWQALNKLANSYDKRFSHRFLVVTPGIPIPMCNAAVR